MKNEMRLLLAEDEPLILLMSQDALEEGGYTVLPACNGVEALETLKAQHDTLSGLILDVRLGAGPNGWELARYARRMHPDVPVLYATGDSAHEWREQGVPNSVVIQKPYASGQIVEAISALLNRKGNGGSAH